MGHKAQTMTEIYSGTMKTKQIRARSCLHFHRQLKLLLTPRSQHRRLDDSELDSGDDEARNDRVAATVEDEEPLYEETKQLKLLNVDVARINPPEGDELFLASIPDFIGIKHKAFDYATYEPPTKPHDGREPSEAKFSPFSTANTSIFWRRDPQNPENIQSNARMIRWSDGSFTMQIASKPTEQYRISTTAMRPGWPRKAGASQQQQEHYDPSKESNNFFVAPHSTSGMDLQIVAPFDASMKIQPTGDTADEAERKLREAIAATSKLNDAPENFKSVKVNPALAKLEAEKAERDIAAAARKVERAQDKQLGRRDKVLGRSGGGRSTGLTVGGLEDDMPTNRGSKAAARRRKLNRHGDILSDEDEDDEAYRRRGREDEYDRDDGFLADSDEEPETYEDDAAEEPAEEDDPDVDDLGIEGRRTVVKGRTRGGARDKTPKRSRDEGEEDAAAEDDPETNQRAPRRQRRVLVEDEEDE